MNRNYRCLSKASFSKGKYSLVPIRDNDRLKIMQWRNEQLYHLRQNKILTHEDQENYFTNVIPKFFEVDYPANILFSYLDDGICIGYGGLVHINWLDKNAEISFLMDTSLEENFFAFHWRTFLTILEEIAFKELRLHKIFTYAYDIRPHLYKAIEQAGFEFEARLSQHCSIDGKYHDVVVHCKINNDE